MRLIPEKQCRKFSQCIIGTSVNHIELWFYCNDENVENILNVRTSDFFRYLNLAPDTFNKNSAYTRWLNTIAVDVFFKNNERQMSFSTQGLCYIMKSE